jgi:hypothetical protein
MYAKAVRKATEYELLLQQATEMRKNQYNSSIVMVEKSPAIVTGLCCLPAAQMPW